jgi:TatD DNase family protein
MLIDSHCHLDYYKPEELPDVLSRAADAGVGQMVTIGTSMKQSATLPDLIEPYPNLWCTIGVHPHNAAAAPIPTPEALVAMTRDPRVIGIGESGLDYFYDKAPRDMQAENFRVHIRAARMAGVPLCIHARDADDDISRILREERERGGAYDFLLHCFSSGRGLAEAALEMGGYLSFSGILTFPKSGELRDIAKDVPPERMLVETDAPYLAPVPYRGKRNEPSYVAHTARVLAEVKGMEPAALADLTTANFRRLFRKAA